MKRIFGWLILMTAVLAAGALGQPRRPTFVLGEKDFLLDGKPFQIISGEIEKGSKIA